MATPDDVKTRVASAYNSAADCYDHTANAFWELYGRRTVERLRVAPGSSVLDLCCGTGASALPAAESTGPGGRVVGVDLAEELCRLGEAKAGRRGLRNIEFRVADILALDFGGQGFDFIVCVFGIFFLPDMAAALRRMEGYLNPGGTLAVTTWGRGLFEPIDSMFWDAVNRVRPELHRTFSPWDRAGDPETVAALFAEAGMLQPTVAFEPGVHPVEGEEGANALLQGTGYRGTLEQLSTQERTAVHRDVAAGMQQKGVKEVRADVIYATWTKPRR